MHCSLIAYGHQVPMADLFGVAGRRLLASLDFPEPWLGHVKASLELIDDLERRIGEIENWLRRSGADLRYLPLLLTCPGIGWITGYTIAAEIGDINHRERSEAVAKEPRDDDRIDRTPLLLSGHDRPCRTRRRRPRP